MEYVLLGVGYLLAVLGAFTSPGTGGRHLKPLMFYFGCGMVAVSLCVIVAGLMG